MNMNRHCRIIKCILSGVVCAFVIACINAGTKRTQHLSPDKCGMIRMEIRSMPMVADFFITMVLTIGMVNTRKEKTILPDWATWECYRTDVTGVGCYSSKDLLNWKFEGIVLSAVKDDPNHDLHPSKVLERPKVIFNKKTGKFVMWAHVESADYSKACAGVAVADSPVGPFVYQGSFRPNNAMSRDQTVFVDDDGRAYQSILRKIMKLCILVF